MLSSYSIIEKKAGCGFLTGALQSHRKRVVPMSVMEVLTLLLVVFAALSYIDNHKKK